VASLLWVILWFFYFSIDDYYLSDPSSDLTFEFKIIALNILDFFTCDSFLKNISIMSSNLPRMSYLAVFFKIFIQSKQQY
jgi:hypothetical protein